MRFLRLSNLCTFMIFLSLDRLKTSSFAFTSASVTTSFVSDNPITTENTSIGTSITESTTTGTITTENMSTGTITTENMSTGTITTENMSTGTITTENMSTGTITTENMSTGTITTENMSTGTITTENMSTGTITTENMSTGTITTENMSTGTITTENMSTGTITTDNMSTGTITTENMSTGTITTENMSTGTITTENMSTGTITTENTSNGASITENMSTGTITTENTSNGASITENMSTGTITTENTSNGASITENTSNGASITENTSNGASITENTSNGASITENTSNGASITENMSTGTITTENTSNGASITESTSTGTITSKATLAPSTSVSTTTVLTSTATPITTMGLILIQTPDVQLSFRIKFNNTLYNDTLKNNTSPYYKAVSDNYTTQLTSAYNETDGFTAVEIRSFRNGSLIVDYIVKFKYNKDNTTQLLENLNSTVLSKLQNLSEVDQDYLQSRYERDLENAKYQFLDAGEDICSLNSCPEGYTCVSLNDSWVKCTSLCATHICQNKGICNVNVKKEPICSCIEDDNYIYGGEYCTEKAEKLSMESETIIAIAAGVGGGLIFILLVALIATCCRRKNPKDKIGESSQMSILPMTEIGDDDAALITRDTSLNTDLATSRLYRDTKAAPSNLREVVPVASFEDDGRSRSGREMRYGDDGRMYHSIPENQIYGMASAGRGYTNKALEGDNDQTMAYFYQPEKISRFGMESSDVNRKRQDETARYSSAPTRDDRSQYISDSAPKREIEPDYFDWSNGAPRSTQEPRFTHTNIDKANTGDPRGHYKSGVDPRTQQQPSSRPYSPDSSAPSYYNDPPQRSNVYDYILAEKPISIRRPTLMPQKR